VISPDDVPVAAVQWTSAVWIIRSIYPPIDLFKDISEPVDWPLLISAEQMTNPRLMDTIGNVDLVPPERRVGGQGASYLMAPFTHTSPDHPSRFSDAISAFCTLPMTSRPQCTRRSTTVRATLKCDSY